MTKNTQIHNAPDKSQDNIFCFNELNNTKHPDEKPNQPASNHWHEPLQREFTKKDKHNTTLLFGGLSNMHDRLLEAGLISLGYKAKALKCPDKEAMQTGKEFGNRGQCNPTYFTVGNLVKFLIDLRDNQGISTHEIIDNNIFLTAGGCGPCRFGMYSTEYRKALQDAGFPDFRIRTFQQDLKDDTSDHSSGLELNKTFFLRIIRCVMIADTLNLMGYKIRPYEIHAGDTDKTLNKCSELICNAIIAGTSIKQALKTCRLLFNKIKVNKIQVKPKVSIIGEFWAMTTEGDGNYHLQRFLESEGAECDIQPITNWLLYMLWTARYDTLQSAKSKALNPDQPSDTTLNVWKKLTLIKAGKAFVKYTFNTYARQVGLSNYLLSDMDKIASLASKHYYRELRGGEGHMEVGKLIHTFQAKKAHLVISVKPFGCMPSSSVSDGVQSLITKQYPGINFLPIETSGDGEVNIYSRIQMALFKARKNAHNEFEIALKEKGVSKQQLENIVLHKNKLTTATFYPRHKAAGSAANIIHSL